MISHGRMSASGYYTTYALGGNGGALSDLGMDEVTAAYRRELKRVQKLKKNSRLVLKFRSFAQSAYYYRPSELMFLVGSVHRQCGEV